MDTADFSGCPDVRLAVLDDLKSVLELMHCAANEDAQHPVDDIKVVDMLRRYYEQQGALLAVIGEPGSPVAYLLMIVDPIWYSQDFQLLELSLFVHPEHRRSNYAKQLMQFSKQASEGLQLDLTIGVLSNDRTEAKVRLYQRQFKTAGAYFMYRPASAETEN